MSLEFDKYYFDNFYDIVSKMIDEFALDFFSFHYFIELYRSKKGFNIENEKILDLEKKLLKNYLDVHRYQFDDKYLFLDIDVREFFEETKIYNEEYKRISGDYYIPIVKLDEIHTKICENEFKYKSQALLDKTVTCEAFLEYYDRCDELAGENGFEFSIDRSVISYYYPKIIKELSQLKNLEKSGCSKKYFINKFEVGKENLENILGFRVSKNKNYKN